MSDYSSVVYLEPDKGWRLPFDVVSCIMITSRRPTISSLMKTCHALYTEGPKHLLRGGVQLDRLVDVDSFANFMLVDSHSRFPHLRKLILSVDSLGTPSTKARFTDFLTHPHLALESLALHHTEVFVGRYAPSSVREALCRLKTLKRLGALRVQEEDTAKMIRSLPCKLESMSIGFEDGIRNGLTTLTPFCLTLRTLVIKWKPYVSTLLAAADNAHFCFPFVRTFGIVYHETAPKFLCSPAFNQAFPAVAHLELIPTSSTVSLRDLITVPLPMTGSRPIRRSKLHLARLVENRVQLQRLYAPPGFQHPDGTRPSLSSLVECSGGLFSVHAFGLSFERTIPTVRLRGHIGLEELPILQTVLRETHPRRLCLSTEMYSAERILAIMHAPQSHPAPERIDLRIIPRHFQAITPCPESEEAMIGFRSSLKSLLRQLPTPGLVELHLLFVIPRRYYVAGLAEKDEAVALRRDALVSFTHWVSSIAPSLILSCRLCQGADDENHRWWPDLGHADDSDIYYDFGFNEDGF